MDAETTARRKNNTWELINSPDEVKNVGMKWVYKIKLN